MIRIFLILAISCFLFSCNVKQSNEKHIIVKNGIFPKDSLQIKAYQLEEAVAKNNYFVFFNLFPSTFEEFINLYSFDDDKGEMPLYHTYEEHINFFFKSYELNKNSFIPKIFNLIKNGHWEADATGILRDNTESFVLSHAQEIIDYLNTKPDEEATGFWHFILDGRENTHLRNDFIKALYSKINSLDSKQGALLRQTFKQMY